MQDHDFEKRVHQKMVELKLHPSETVWEQVEIRLQHKEKRRRWIIWLPLMLVAIALGGYLYQRSGHKPSEKDIKALALRPERTPVNNNKNPISRKDTSITSTQPVSTTEIIKEYPAGKMEPAGSNNHLHAITINPTFSKESRKRSRLQNFLLKSSNPLSFDNDPGKVSGNKNSGDHLPGVVNSSIAREPLKNEKYRDYNLPDYGTPSSEKNNLPAIIDHYDEKELFSVAVKEYPISTNSANIFLLQLQEKLLPKVETKVQAPHRSWEWGLSFQAGRSSLTNGSFNKLFGGAAMDNLSSNINQPGVGTGNNSLPNAVYKELYPLKSGVGFFAGVFVKKQLSRRFTFSAGLNYLLFTTTNRVGLKVDSNISVQSAFAGNRLAIGQYYRSGNTGSYTNKYHFIELPVVLQTRISNSRRMPVYWDLGFSLSRLITTNALNFDSGAGVYYQNDEGLHKTQINIVTGLPIGLFSQRKFSLQVGPEFQYGITKILPGGTNPGKRFIFFGLKASLLIGKK